MCDIGRFDYHWIESDRRLLQPFVRKALLPATPGGRTGSDDRDAVSWADALVSVKTAVDQAGGPQTVRFLVSGHASLEELYALAPYTPSTGGVTLSWRYREKPQPANVKFKIPAVDAPNVTGARDLGFNVGNPHGPADISSLRSAVDAGRVHVLYVFDSGPDGSIGDVDWILAARNAGKIRTLIYQGVLQNALSENADILLPGSAFVEKDATYTNMTGRVQGAARVIPPPGDAAEDWQILSKLAVVFGAEAAPFTTAADVRAAIAQQLSSNPAYEALKTMTFARPVSARHWLNTSNPSERWKWDFMFQDLPPIKFGEDFGPLPRADVIPLREVK
jgi:predicted molibdopterin-dependent oxidoreductase YjgC